MARPFKSGVDYFPLDVNPDDKVKIVEAEHDLIGFGIWIKLLQKIYADGYWIKWDKKAEIVFSKEVNVDKNKVNVIINSCIEWCIFEKKLFEDHSILTSKGIQKRYFKICERRKQIEVVEDYLLVDVPEVDGQEIVYVNINPVNVNRSTQSKVKEIKGKKNTYSNEFESVWNITPKRNGTKQGKKPASLLFEKLSIEDKRKVYKGLKNYASFIDLPTTTQSAMDLERFIRNRFFDDYQEEIKSTTKNKTNGDDAAKKEIERTREELLNG